MTWSPMLPAGAVECLKTRWRSVPYTQGRGLDLGCGNQKFMDTEFVIGIDNGRDAETQGAQINANIRSDVKQLTQFASGAFDFVFSSFVLQHFPHAEVPTVLREWMRVLKVGGNICLYLPDENQYPKVGEQYVNPQHQWNVNYDRVVEAMAKTFFNWDLIDYEVCDKNDEYALWFVFKKLKA